MKQTSIDYTGTVIDRLTVIGRSGRRGREAAWDCLCICGNTIQTVTHRIKGCRIHSCGCLKREGLQARLTTHGHAPDGKPTSEYMAWGTMKHRCYNPNNPAYKHYGGRGIKVCDRWLESYQNFIDDVGLKPTPKHTLDRYPNNDGNYEPGNVRWATWDEQKRNTRNNVWLEYNGKRLIVKDWADLLTIAQTTLRVKLKTQTFEEICKVYLK